MKIFSILKLHGMLFLMVLLYSFDFFLTVFLHKRDLDNLFSKVKFFCRETKFKVNRSKNHDCKKNQNLGFIPRPYFPGLRKNIKLLEKIF